VTHDRGLARRLDRVLELHEGRLRELAPADV
jgi:lipoprotein-releasing system ATP-binding protein